MIGRWFVFNWRSHDDWSKGNGEMEISKKRTNLKIRQLSEFILNSGLEAICMANWNQMRGVGV